MDYMLKGSLKIHYHQGAIIRKSMLDTWTSAMMDLAFETDILENLSNDKIIDKFAEINRIYSSLLVKK